MKNIALLFLVAGVAAGDDHSPRRLATDGTRVAVASDDKAVRVWDAASGRLLHTLATDRPARAVAFAGDHLVAAEDGGRESAVRIWKLKDGKYEPTATIPVYGLPIGLVASPDGKWCVEIGVYCHISLIDVAAGKLRRVWQEAGNPLGDAAFAPDGKTVFTLGQSLRNWDLKLDKLDDTAETTFEVSAARRTRDEATHLRWKKAHGNAVTAVGDRVVAIGGYVNRTGHATDLCSFDAATGGDLKPLAAGLSDATFLAASPDGKSLLIGFDSELVEIRSITGEKLRTIKLPGFGRTRSGAFLKDSKSLAITNEGGSKVEIVDASTGELVRSLAK